MKSRAACSIRHIARGLLTGTLVGLPASLPAQPEASHDARRVPAIEAAAALYVLSDSTLVGPLSVMVRRMGAQDVVEQDSVLLTRLAQFLGATPTSAGERLSCGSRKRSPECDSEDVLVAFSAPVRGAREATLDVMVQVPGASRGERYHRTWTLRLERRGESSWAVTKVLKLSET
jgi:hypothetical protein